MLEWAARSKLVDHTHTHEVACWPLRALDQARPMVTCSGVGGWTESPHGSLSKTLGEGSRVVAEGLHGT